MVTALNLVLLVANTDEPNESGLGSPLADALGALAYLAASGLGALVASRRPRNPIGWLFCVGGLALALAGAASEYADYGLVTEPGSLPVPRVVAWVGAWTWWGAAGSMVTFVFLLFPEGHLPSRRWRPVAWLATGDLAALVLLQALTPGPLSGEYRVAVNPFGVEAAPGLLERLRPIGFVLLTANAVIGITALVVRLRTSKVDEQQQIKWFPGRGSGRPVRSRPVHRRHRDRGRVVRARASACAAHGEQARLRRRGHPLRRGHRLLTSDERRVLRGRRAARDGGGGGQGSEARSRVRLFLPDGGHQEVTWPDPADARYDQTVTVVHQGETLGDISVAKAPGDQLTRHDERLLSDLAAQAGLAMRNLRLTGEPEARLRELQASRERIVAAQDQERRRMERDLHDGAQQRLIAISIKLRLVKGMLGTSPEEAAGLLGEVQDDLKDAVELSATLPSGRTQLAVRASSWMSTWRNCSVDSATAVERLWPTAVVLQPPPLTTYVVPSRGRVRS